MKTITTTAIVALMTASLGLGAVAPAFAQDAPAAQAEPAQPAKPGFRGPQRGGFGNILGFERGSEAVEIALVRLAHRLDLTEAQQGLLDTLKSDALAAAETFGTATQALRPAAGETGQRPDFSASLENRIALEKARLAALESVQPAFTAFFDSLTDEQKTALAPQRPERGERPHRADRQGRGLGDHSGGPRQR